MDVTISPRGPFSLERAATFGFGGRLGAPPFDGAMRLAFAVDGLREHAGVIVRETGDGDLTCRIDGAHDEAAVRRQVERILSLDHDGEQWLSVGERDPVIGDLQARHPGVRPVLFHSPYEAAAWAVVSTRRPAAQAVEVRRRLSEELGATFDLDGAPMSAFPLPERLLDVQAGPGLPEQRAERLRELARIALEGRLEAPRLQELGPDTAREEVRRVPGIGPFYADLIVVRATGFADVLTSQEPRVLRHLAALYGLDGPPGPGELEELAEPWRPFRTWATVLVRYAGEHAAG